MTLVISSVAFEKSSLPIDFMTVFESINFPIFLRTIFSLTDRFILNFQFLSATSVKSN